VKAPTTAEPGALARYLTRRNFARTPEPAATTAPAAQALRFVVQQHHARRLHYDLRLELDGVLLSWAVPKGPSLDPRDRRLAVRTEDHPLSYIDFEGRIPAGEYGAGSVVVWDRGHWSAAGDARRALADGKLVFDLHGEKLQGRFELVRTRADAGKEHWLLFKKKTGASPPAGAGPLPPMLQPQLASAVEMSAAAIDMLDPAQWLFETKFDGYRLLCRIEDGQPRLFTRAGNDWTARLPALADTLRALQARSAWLDGEIVVHGDDGRADFNALQQAFDRRTASADIVYWLFDLPYFEGRDLRGVALQSRRELLRQWLQARLGDSTRGPLRFSAEIEAPLAAALRRACRDGVEGLIAKRRDSAYRASRGDAWLKLKCVRRQEFVIGGYLLRQGSRREVGSLLLGVYGADGTLRHVGRVGAGFASAAATRLHDKLKALRRAESPFAAPEPPASRRNAGTPTWVAPTLVAEVAFAEWTPAGHIRQARFIAEREDKPAHAVRREVAQPPAARAPSPALRALHITHGERVIDAACGCTKRELIAYYDAMAPYIVPQLAQRAVALMRAPDGVAGATFFQKHAGHAALPGVRELDATLWPGHEPLLEVHDRSGLLAAAQMNTIEFHTWGSRVRSLGSPDRIVFDLDPGAGVAFATVREAAQLLHGLLKELGLQCWLKTSGGKGLHVLVPIVPRWSFGVVKAFSKSVADHLARTLPDRFVARSGESHRVGRVFVDYLRNAEGASTVAAYSARARPGLGVSMPIEWALLSAVDSGAHWSVADAPAHVAARERDPWADMGRARQSIASAIKTLSQ
jgi:bifunctional non-homologous end joining protein LigD